MTSTRGPGQRAGLSAEAVLAAARELLAEGGVDALTMRALARRLDVAPNALYSHVESRTALLDALLDDLLAGVAPPRATQPGDALAQLMTSTYEVLTASPDLVPLYLARQGARGPNAVRLGAVMDDLLAAAGVRPADVPEARRALIVHAIGSAAFTSAPADRALSSAQSRRAFGRSLRWLLAGITG